jgi:predicted HicB family RNase H-like nuclease
MPDLNIAYYCHSRCIPLRSITELPENEAFQTAYQLGLNDGTSFGRFKDFINYYPKRIKAEKWLYEWFIKSGGEPKTEHPLYFVLEQSNYLHEWFDKGNVIKIPFSIINSKHISFTIGDSMATFKDDFNGIRKDPIFKEEVYKLIEEHNGKLDKYLEKMDKKYIECQLWNKEYLENIDKFNIFISNEQ